MDYRPLNEQNQQPYYEPEPTIPEKIIGNILKSIVSIFLIVIGFFIVALVVSSIASQQAIEFETYTHDFSISNPTLEQVIYTSNPHLSLLGIQKYNSTNASYGWVDNADWSYDSTYASITINAGALEHTITGLHVHANTGYAESQYVNVFSAIALSLIIGAIMTIFGIVAWRCYNNPRTPY